MYAQFIHLGAYGLTPRAGEPPWSCIDGITTEGARQPNASRHIPYPREPRILAGVSPLEVGKLAKERALLAKDAKGRRLRREGVSLIAGVASYPVPRLLVDDVVQVDFYTNWQTMTLDWLQDRFGKWLMSVVEHDDEEYFHLHFYLVPNIMHNLQLDLPLFHPGRAIKAAASEVGATKRDQEAAYRCGMEFFQADFHYDVSRKFGHQRYGAKRRRESRRVRLEIKRIETEAERHRNQLEAERAEFERERNAQLRVLEQIQQQLILEFGGSAENAKALRD